MSKIQDDPKWQEAIAGVVAACTSSTDPLVAFGDTLQRIAGESAQYERDQETLRRRALEDPEVKAAIEIAKERVIAADKLAAETALAEAEKQ